MFAPMLFTALVGLVPGTQADPAREGVATASIALPAWDEKSRARIARLSPLGPPPSDPTNRVADDPRAAQLGQFLFFDPRLSAPGTVACATCHDPAKAFQDGLPAPHTIGQGKRRTPSLLGVAYARWFFWDGRADSLWSQALVPIENPIEMGSSRLAVAHLVHDDPDLRRAYEDLFGPLPALDDSERFPPDGLPLPSVADSPRALAWSAMSESDRVSVDEVFANVGKVLAAYERRLVPGRSAFDRFAEALAQDDEEGMRAMDPAAQRGLALFLGRANCMLCHAGPSFTDMEFHNTGAPAPGGGEELDSGRYAGIQELSTSAFQAGGIHSDEPDGTTARRVKHLRLTSDTWGEFKTPSLRNVASRGPYMHGGQLLTLEAVLRFYSTLEGASGRSHHQELTLVPIRLTEEETADLLAFLGSLTGEPLPDELLRAPAKPVLDPER
jgi:cytochrome c peroxidase